MARTLTSPEVLQGQLLERAAKDEAFRQELLARPGPVLEKELGITLEKGLEIQVVEETPKRIVLVLPMRSGAVAPAELSEEQLAAAAGGVRPGLHSSFQRLLAFRRESGGTSSSSTGEITPINLP